MTIKELLEGGFDEETMESTDDELETIESREYVRPLSFVRTSSNGLHEALKNHYGFSSDWN